MSDQVVEQESTNPFAIFSEKVKEPVEGLTYLGHLEESVEFCGHTFVLKTLRPSEKAAVAMAVKDWRETLTEADTWGNALVGMSLVSVDGDDSFCPPAGPDPNSFARARLNYVTGPKGWHQPTLTFLLESMLSLEVKAAEAMSELQDLSSRSQQPLQPSAASLTVPGTSSEETTGDSPPSETSS